MIKEILIWIIIIAFAWYVFSGGLYEISDWLKENVKLGERTVSKENYIRSYVDCFSYKLLRDTNRGMADDYMDNECLSDCKDNGLIYGNKYECSGDTMYCLCK